MAQTRDWVLPASAFTTAIACRQLVDACDTLPPDTLEVAQVLVTELVTDALLDTEGDIHFAVASSRARLRVAVESRRRKPPSSLMPGRRRSQLVDRLAARWGIEPGEDGSWCVWFELPVAAVDDSAAPPR